MRVNPLVCGAVALRTVYAQADSKRVHDSLTGITFSAYTSGDTRITFSVTLPMNVSDPYDAIISITAPVSNTTWAGFAWGGTMVWTPLTVAWANVIEYSDASGLSLPQACDDAENTLLEGTMVNSTHWTMAAKCSGCTSYQGNDGVQVGGCCLHQRRGWVTQACRRSK
ncbi:hypothetical protein BGZ57DRAFT_206272 [Hyaloscypha finlandica]|nr:hypothetical protein BGZ57DRAFT_206272 [Hyaloscypha finlandica]